MASSAVSAVGTVFQRWNGKKWVNLSEVQDITGPSMKRGTIEVTSLDSVKGYKEFIAGFREGGTVVLKMNFTRDGWDLMKGDFESDVEQNYQIVLPDPGNTSFEFIGLVIDLPVTIPTGSQIGMSVTIQISGELMSNTGASTGV